MHTDTFALITPEKTQYVDVTRADGDMRSWRDIVLEYGLAAGLVAPDELNAATVLPAKRPAPPKPFWR